MDKVLEYPNNKYSEDAMLMGAEMAYTAKAYEMFGESFNFCKLAIFHLEKSLMHRIEREEGIHC